jgi:hypothetical protein
MPGTIPGGGRRAHLAYVETALDAAREQDVLREDVLPLLVAVIEPMLEAAADR